MSRVIHAPCANLVTSTIASTRPVIMKPTTLTARERRTFPRSDPLWRLRSWAFQWRIIPSCDRVKEMKTPTT